MPSTATASGYPLLFRIGATLAGIALVVPSLSVPACFGFVAIVGGAGLLRSNGAARRSRRRRSPRRRSDRVEQASEDSFPASDPPSWTPVAGTGTRH